MKPPRVARVGRLRVRTMDVSRGISILKAIRMPSGTELRIAVDSAKSGDPSHVIEILEQEQEFLRGAADLDGVKESVDAVYRLLLEVFRKESDETTPGS